MLRMGVVADPAPGATDVVVRVHAAALNPKDALFRRGKFARLSGQGFPKHVGVDFAGVVDAAGPRATLVVGARVFGALQEWRYLRGTLGELVLAHAAEVARLPDAVDFEAGAAISLAGLTSLQVLRGIARVKAGDGTLAVLFDVFGNLRWDAVRRALPPRAALTASMAPSPCCPARDRAPSSPRPSPSRAAARRRATGVRAARARASGRT